MGEYSMFSTREMTYIWYILIKGLFYTFIRLRYITPHFKPNHNNTKEDKGLFVTEYLD